MPTLWTFGDSFTAKYNSEYEWAEQYIKWKGYIPKVYGEIVSDRLGLNLINLGKPGSDNNQIIETIIDNIDSIKKDDVIIIGWSNTCRFRLTTKDNNWEYFYDYTKPNLKDMENISQQTISEILINRHSKNYELELEKWIKLLNKTFINNKIVNWSYFSDKIGAYYFRHFHTIKDETNGVLKDNHFSERGHLELSKTLIEIINKGYYKKKMI